MFENWDRPRWLRVLTDIVRPGGVALMFLVITLLPLLFAMVEVGLQGVGLRMASVLASYFQAVPDIYYTTLQVMFSVYVLGKSGEAVASSVSKKKDVTVSAETADVKVDQRANG